MRQGCCYAVLKRLARAWYNVGVIAVPLVEAGSSNERRHIKRSSVRTYLNPKEHDDEMGEYVGGVGGWLRKQW